MLYKELEEILQDSSAVFTLSEQKSLRKLKVQILSFLEKQLDEYQKAFPITLIPGTQGSSGHRRQGSGTTFKPSSFSRATGAALALNQSGLSSASYSPSQSSPMQAATLSPLAASAPIPPLEPYRMQGSSPNWDSRALKATIQLISLLNNHDEGKLVQLLSIHLKVSACVCVPHQSSLSLTHTHTHILDLLARSHRMPWKPTLPTSYSSWRRCTRSRHVL